MVLRDSKMMILGEEPKARKEPEKNPMETRLRPWMADGGLAGGFGGKHGFGDTTVKRFGGGIVSVALKKGLDAGGNIVVFEIISGLG